jgi:hypothetical protein
VGQTLVDSKANETLDAMLGAGATLFPGTVFIGLMTATPNLDGSGVVEPVGNGYARVSVTNDGTEWSAAASREKTHINDITFPAASGGSWGTVTTAGIFDALSGGNLLAFGALDASRTINDTDVFRFLASTSSLKLTI